MVAEAGGDKRDGGIAKQNNSVAIAFDPIDKYILQFETNTFLDDSIAK